MIDFIPIDVELPGYLNDTIKAWIDEIIRFHGKKTGEVFFLFCSDDYLYELNKQFLQHDELTDIITFDNSVSDEIINTEIYISVDRVGENALKLAQSIENELFRVMIHGILHLIGYGDASKTEQTEMRKQEDIALEILLNN